jgi:putative membrane protein
VLACAPFVLIVDIGGMYAYYLTPLFAETDRHTWLHLAVHAHMFVAGCLLAWYLIGRDPMPARPSTRSAVLVLLLAAGSHDLLAKLMFAYDLPSGAGSAVDIRVGAQLMFYGGDAVELALALAIMLAWYSRTGRELDRQRRRLNAVAVRSATSTRLLRQGALRPDAGDNGNRFESD